MSNELSKALLIMKLNDILREIDVIVEGRPSANDCVGWAKNAQEKIDQLQDLIVDYPGDIKDDLTRG